METTAPIIERENKMGLSHRTVFELHCDVPACPSTISGPTQQAVVDAAFRDNGWRFAPIQQGHGSVDIVHQCARHTGLEPA